MKIVKYGNKNKFIYNKKPCYYYKAERQRKTKFIRLLKSIYGILFYVYIA